MKLLEPANNLEENVMVPVFKKIAEFMVCISQLRKAPPAPNCAVLHRCNSE